MDVYPAGCGWLLWWRGGLERRRLRHFSRLALEEGDCAHARFNDGDFPLAAALLCCAWARQGYTQISDRCDFFFFGCNLFFILIVLAGVRRRWTAGCWATGRRA